MREEANSVNGSPSKPLSKDDMYALFDALSERLQRKRARADIYLVGGAVMALAFDRDRITGDIDARIDAGRGALALGRHLLPPAGAPGRVGGGAHAARAASRFPAPWPASVRKRIGSTKDH